MAVWALFIKERDKEAKRGSERERDHNPEFTVIETREKPNQGLARPSPHQFPLLPHGSRVQRIQNGVPNVRLEVGSIVLIEPFSGATVVSAYLKCFSHFEVVS